MTSFFFAQTNQNVKVFLDCRNCDIDYYKQEMDYSEFVRDRKYADVHILFTKQSNASNGKHYNLQFIGQNNFSKINDNLSFDTSGETTKEQRRDIVLKNLKLGLIRYWIASGLKDKITVKLKTQNKAEITEQKDVWNKWTFRVGLNGYFNGQESSNSSYINGSFRVKQVTEKNKVNFSVGLSNNKSNYSYGTTDIVSENKSTYMNLNDVVSISNHLSVGLFLNAGESSYSNKSFYFQAKPGIEYDFFSYEESQKKALVLTYKIGYVLNKYFSKTVYDKTKESLFQHNLSLDCVVIKKWGNVSGGIAYRSYLHNTSLNGFRANISTSLRLIKGLSINLNGSYGLSHDQINLKAQGATLEELLLQQQQLKSGYNYYGSIGLSYTFGSIYNTIVNPRFDF